MELEAIKSAFSSATDLSEWSSAIVAIGVIIELVALFLFDKEKPRKEWYTLFLGSILVVLGVLGEWIFSSRAAALADKLQQASDQKVASAQQAAADANAKAADALKQAANLGVSQKSLHAFVETQKKLTDGAIGELQKRTADLNAARSDARAAADMTKKDLVEMTSLLNQESALRQQMIALMTPRSFSPAQRADFVQRLSSFSPRRIDILTFGDTREIAEFGRALSDAIQAAGWRPKVWSVFSGASLGVTGVPIFVREGAPAGAIAASSALETALLAEEVDAKKFGPFKGTALPVGGVNGPPWDESDVADIRVFVGPKP